jgi:hypothetical protein
VTKEISMAPYVRGRLTIRKTTDLNNQSTSKIIGLWSIEPKPGTTLARLEQAYLTGIESIDRTEAKSREYAASGRYTLVGAKQATLNSALSDVVPSLHRARQTIKNAKAEVEALRSKITPLQTDKTDLVAAMLRAEMRDFLRAMPQAERNQYMSKNLDRLDPQMAQAVMEVPVEMTGISGTQRDVLIERTLQAQHGDTIAEIKELERGIELAERAVEAGRDEVRKEAGVDQKVFDELAAPIEAKQTVAWLRRRAGSDEVRVIDLERGVERLPTPEELANGIEASSLDEFNARKAA